MGRKVFQPNPGSVKYSSLPTRFLSLHSLMGGAEIEEVNIPSTLNPGELKENLEFKRNSGVNRTDIPSMWGYAQVDRRLADKKLPTAEERFSWRRNKGEPINED